MKLKAFSLFILCLSSGPAGACSPPPFVADYHATGSSIQVGYIVAERLPDFETYVLSKSDPSKPKPARGMPRRFVRVAFTEALKGKLSAPREVLVACGASTPAIRKRVFVVRINGNDYLVPADFPGYENELRVILGKPLTTQSSGTSE